MVGDVTAYMSYIHTWTVSSTCWLQIIEGAVLFLGSLTVLLYSARGLVMSQVRRIEVHLMRNMFHEHAPLM